MFKNIYLIILVFILTTQCGYQVVNQKDLRQFYIKSIELEGEKRLNHIISKNILFYPASYRRPYEIEEIDNQIKKEIDNGIISAPTSDVSDTI